MATGPRSEASPSRHTLHKDSTLSASASALLTSPYSQKLGRRRPVGEAAATKIAGRPEAVEHPLVLADKQAAYNRALGSAKFSTAIPTLPPFVSPVRSRSGGPQRANVSASGSRPNARAGASVGVERPLSSSGLRPSSSSGRLLSATAAARTGINADVEEGAPAPDGGAGAGAAPSGRCVGAPNGDRFAFFAFCFRHSRHGAFAPLWHCVVVVSSPPPPPPPGGVTLPS